MLKMVRKTWKMDVEDQAAMDTTSLGNVEYDGNDDVFEKGAVDLGTDAIEKIVKAASDGITALLNAMEADDRALMEASRKKAKSLMGQARDAALEEEATPDQRKGIKGLLSRWNGADEMARKRTESQNSKKKRSAGSPPVRKHSRGGKNTGGKSTPNRGGGAKKPT
jgi:hypothetical protein